MELFLMIKQTSEIMIIILKFYLICFLAFLGGF